MRPAQPGERVRGLRVLATAATRGIGLAVARRLAAEGARVVLSGSGGPSLDKARADVEAVAGAGASVYALPLDVRAADAIERGAGRARALLGGIDSLFVNVPGARPGGLDDLGEDDWLGAFELYLLSVLRLVGAVRGELTTAGPGRVVVVSSYVAIEALDGLTLSNVLRPAVQALVRELARALGPEGVLVNAILPGRIATQRLQAVDEATARAEGTTAEAVRARAEGAVPLGRYADPDELARLAVFLLSRENTYVTGQCLLVDGGLVRAP